MDSFRLVFISLTSFFLFVILSFFLRKLKNYPFLFVFFSSFLPLISLLRKGVYQSDDFALHIERAIDLWNSLKFGIFPVHWAASLNSTYGYPLFIFIYPLPYYSIALLKLLGVSLIFAEKLIIATTFILSGIGMYKLTRTFLKPLPSAFAGVLYLFAPYHLVDMHFRVAIGELFVFALLPFIFYLVVELSKKNSFFNFYTCSLCFAGVLLSHPAMSIVTTPLIFALPFFLKSRYKTKIYLSLVVGIFLSAFYWLPALLEINSSLQASYGKTISFENPLLYLLSPWRNGFLFQGPTGEISFPMGYVQLCMLGISLLFLRTAVIKKTHKKILVFSLFLFFFFLVLLFPVSLPIWKMLPMMTNFQFAYRLMLPISFLLAVIGGISSAYINKRIIVLIALLTIITTILNWGTRGVIGDITDEYLIRHLPLSTAEGEGLQAAVPKWGNPNILWFKTSPTSHVAILKGEAIINSTERTPIIHNYNVHVLKESMFTENTLYFPGWKLYVNGKTQQFEIDSGKTGLIIFSLPPGSYKVSLKFEDTPDRSLGNIISFSTLTLLTTYLIFHFISQRLR